MGNGNYIVKKTAKSANLLAKKSEAKVNIFPSLQSFLKN